MRHRLNQAARTPEIVIPVVVLAVALALALAAILLIRPDASIAAALIAAVAGAYGTILSVMPKPSCR